MSTHTPGPWKKYRTGGLAYWNVRGADGSIVAQMCLADEDGREEANAGLIASAPELAALVGELTAALRKADQAIARGQDVTSQGDFHKWRTDSQALRPTLDLIRNGEARAQPAAAKGGAA